MRTKNSFKNISMSIITQFTMVLLGFLSRKIFLDNLGITYLGVNGLLTNVLSLLGLLEGGIGISITYNLYKPLADNDTKKVTALMQLFRKAYIVIAAIVCLLSILLYPIIISMIGEDESIKNMTIVYIIFMMKNVLSYLYAYKWTIINADQKGYILSKRNLIFSIITTICKIIVLMVTRNYVLFLIIEVMIMIFQSVANGRVVDRLYPYIREKQTYQLDKETKYNIIENVKALFLHSIGSYCVFGTDNLIISKFVNVASVGLYSNYSMIIGQLTTILGSAIGGIGSSVGNLIATESEEKTYEVFKVSYLINFWSYSLCIVILYNLLNPFIDWWLGEGYLLDRFTFIVILVNCYLGGLRGAIGTFKVKAGIFVQDKYMPLIESVINLSVSLILVNQIGLAGVFLGTTISSVCIVFWNVPRLVYKHVFHQPVYRFFLKYALYAGLTILMCFLTQLICDQFVIGDPFFSLIVKGLVCCIIPNAFYILLFYKTKEFKQILSVMKYLMHDFLSNRVSDL